MSVVKNGKVLSRARLMLWLSLAWVVCAFIQVTVLRDYGFSLKAAFADALVSNGLLCAYSILTILVFRMFNANFQDVYQRLGWVLSVTAIIVFKEKWLIHFLLSDPAYDAFFQQHIYLRVCVTILFTLLVTLLTSMWYYFQEQKAAMLQREKAQQALKESELNKLRQQLQPHFLFNSLNSISALVVSEPKQARKMIQNLSDFLRGTIKKEDNQLTTLGEELTLLELYLSIEKVRFGHRLQTQIDVSEGVEGSKLPPLLLQPLLENSIKFGLYDVLESVTITLTAKLNQENLEIELTNPYDEQTAQQRYGEGFGLAAVTRRLYLIYGRNDLLTITRKDNQFTCLLRIPQHYVLTPSV